MAASAFTSFSFSSSSFSSSLHVHLQPLPPLPTPSKCLSFFSLPYFAGQMRIYYSYWNMILMGDGLYGRWVNGELWWREWYLGQCEQGWCLSEYLPYLSRLYLSCPFISLFFIISLIIKFVKSIYLIIVIYNHKSRSLCLTTTTTVLTLCD
jgi:hypothetical protein